MKAPILFFLFILFFSHNSSAVADYSKTPANKRIVTQKEFQFKKIIKGKKKKAHLKFHKKNLKKRIKRTRYKESSFYGSMAMFLLFVAFFLGFAGLWTLVLTLGGFSLFFALIGLWQDENKKPAKRTLYTFLGLAILWIILVAWILIVCIKSCD